MRRNPLIHSEHREQRARRIAATLFFATCCSVYLVRWLRWEVGEIWASRSMWNAWLFTATLMATLLAHELGHYIVARRHRFRLSLPWFLPAPVMIGTLGAVIRLEEEPKTRAGLLEMGAAGPLAGMGVVVVVMLVRLMSGEGSTGGIPLATPLLWKALSLLVVGEVLPLDTADPLGFAAWLGCLLTAMNLLPLGQLDGGHVIAALTPTYATWVGWFTTAVLLVAGLWWPGWALWAALLHVMGARHPLRARRDEGVPVGRPLWIAGGVAVTWVLVVVPVPF